MIIFIKRTYTHNRWVPIHVIDQVFFREIYKFHQTEKFDHKTFFLNNRSLTRKYWKTFRMKKIYILRIILRNIRLEAGSLKKNLFLDLSHLNDIVLARAKEVLDLRRSFIRKTSNKNNCSNILICTLKNFLKYLISEFRFPVSIP